MDFRAYYLRKKYWLNDFIHGAQMWRQYRDVMKIMNMPKDNKNVCGGGKRAKYLKDILSFAGKNVPYYTCMERMEKLQDFPVVNKQTYLSDYSAFCVPKENIPFQRGELHVQKTSGSTGTPFQVPQDTRCRLRRIAIIKAENEKIGFHSFEPMMHLRAVAHYWDGGRDFFYSKGLNIIYIDNSNLNEGKIKKIISAVDDYRVKVIRGYMTTLDTITRYMEDRQLRFNHKITFISVGELLQEWLRKRIVDYLHCDIISQYGNEENGIFGQSEINGSGRHINLNGAGCAIEILRLDSDEPAKRGELGRIVVTDFTNYAMPMIRYEIGDLAAPCDFYDDGTVKSIDNLSGRITDIIYRTDGCPIDFYNSIPVEIFINPKIRQFQFIQKDAKEYVIRLSFTDDAIKEQESHIVKKLKYILGADAIVRIDWVNELPVLNSGKRKIIINEWKQKMNKYSSPIQ